MVQSFNPTGSFSGILHTSLPAFEFHCHHFLHHLCQPYQPNTLTSELHPQKFSRIMNFQSKRKETIRVNKILLCSMNRRWPHWLVTPLTYSLVRSEWRLSGYHALCSTDTFFMSNCTFDANNVLFFTKQTASRLSVSERTLGF